VNNTYTILVGIQNKRTYCDRDFCGNKNSVQYFTSFYLKKALAAVGAVIAGANPTIVSYNASAVKIYSATSSLVRFENKSILIYFEKRSGLLQRRR
jgi:hypothetical protein